MKNLMGVVLCIVLLAIILVMTGCTSQSALLRNDTGKTYFCSGEGFGIIGALVATSKYNECITRATAKGYK